MKKIFFYTILFPLFSISQVPNILKDLTPGSAGSTISAFTSLPNNDVIFCVFSPTATAGLWRTDGSTNGTFRFKQGITTTTITSSNSGGIASVNYIDYINKKFFISNTPGYILWKTDGTAAGTDSIPVSNLIGATYIALYNNIIYFAGLTTAEGRELWRTDGTTAGTYMIKDIWPGANSGVLSPLSFYNNEIYFIANNGINGEELWKSDGTTSGTVLIKDINPGSNGASISLINVANNGVYFLANDGVVGAEPWFTGGSTANTNLVYDLNFGPNGSFTSPALFNGNNSYFIYGQKIIKSSGTPASTSSISIGQAIISELKIFNSKIHYISKVSIFAGIDTIKLNCADLNLSSHQLIKSYEINHAWAPNIAIFNQTLNSKMLITLWGSFSSDPNYVLITNGNTNGCKFFSNVCNSGHHTQGYSSVFGSINNKVYFPNSYLNQANGVEPGYIDLQNDTIIQIKDLSPGGNTSYYFSIPPYWSFKLYSLLNKNYFIAQTPSNGEEIFETDFTSTGTFLLKDIYPGSSSFQNPGSPLFGNYSYGDLGKFGSSIVTPNNIYFTANDGINGMELWSFINAPNGINENKKTDFNLSLFPNPSKENITIKCDATITNLIFNDVLGRTIKEIIVSQKSEIEIKTSDLEIGIYFVTIKTNKGNIIKKIIKD
ncbi:ELWxxDGT repeat protein [Sediminibacterium sp.]|uniref:ELWxxDGT repeat protein n=1 Tax=Sediminibacterium sp. TaxID=1917865 RepID=UPI002732D334|nr:ELWxxDGT repeat protein [Sediminibacterium sp.]MDP3567337.1 T9SS type A sorting domain-containing protein [Sediminibacterium sp.]